MGYRRRIHHDGLRGGDFQRTGSSGIAFRTTHGIPAVGDNHEAGPLWQPAGCHVGLELSGVVPVLICGTGWWHVSVNPLHIYALPKTELIEDHSPGKKGSVTLV